MKEILEKILIVSISSVPGFLMLFLFGMKISLMMIVIYLIGAFITVMLAGVLNKLRIRGLRVKGLRLIIIIKSVFFELVGIKVYYYAERYFDVDQEKVEQWLKDKKMYYWTRDTTFEESFQFEQYMQLEEPFVYVYYFLRKKDAMMFKLVWGEK